MRRLQYQGFRGGGRVVLLPLVLQVVSLIALSPGPSRASTSEGGGICLLQRSLDLQGGGAEELAETAKKEEDLRRDSMWPFDGMKSWFRRRFFRKKKKTAAPTPAPAARQGSEMGCSHEGEVCGTYVGCYEDVEDDIEVSLQVVQGQFGIIGQGCRENCARAGHKYFFLVTQARLSGVANVHFKACYCGDSSAQYSKHGRLEDIECGEEAPSCEFERNCGRVGAAAIFRVEGNATSCAWRPTGDCNRPGGTGGPDQQDLLCDAVVRQHNSGFCDCNGNGVQDLAEGEEQGYSKPHQRGEGSERVIVPDYGEKAFACDDPDRHQSHLSHHKVRGAWPSCFQVCGLVPGPPACAWRTVMVQKKGDGTVATRRVAALDRPCDFALSQLPASTRFTQYGGFCDCDGDGEVGPGEQEYDSDSRPTGTCREVCDEAAGSNADKN